MTTSIAVHLSPVEIRYLHNLLSNQTARLLALANDSKGRAKEDLKREAEEAHTLNCHLSVILAKNEV